MSHKDLGFISIPLPTIQIQRDTIGKIEHHAAKQNQVRTGIESQIATLTAYRKSLIHECVTGQRRITEADVRRAGGCPSTSTPLHSTNQS